MLRPGITLACVGVTVVSLVTLLAREEVASTDTRSTAIGIGLTLIAMVSSYKHLASWLQAHVMLCSTAASPSDGALDTPPMLWQQVSPKLP